MNTKETTLHFVIREDKSDKNGKAPLFLRITRERKTSYRSLGLKVHVSEWDKTREKVNRSHPNSTRFNNLLEAKKTEVEGTLLTTQKEQPNYSSLGLKEKLRQREELTIQELFNEKIAHLFHMDAIATGRRYKVVIKKINNFIGSEKLALIDIDYDWLLRFEHHLSHDLNNGVNTVHTNIKCIRAVITETIRRGIIDVNHNPFVRFKIKREATNVEYLSKSELCELEELYLDPTSQQHIHRQMFVFACYCGGIRVSDLLTLRWSAARDGRVNFVMRKTNRPINYAIPRKALAILEEFKKENTKPSDLVFPVLTGRSMNNESEIFQAISSYNALINKSLRAMAKKLGWTRKLHFHLSRHTFATTALRNGIRIEHVSAILGHASIKETQRYAKVGSRELDLAMELMS